MNRLVIIQDIYFIPKPADVASLEFGKSTQRLRDYNKKTNRRGDSWAIL